MTSSTMEVAAMLGIGSSLLTASAKMTKRGEWLICLLALMVGALATTTDKVAEKNEPSGKTDTLRGYLEKIKNSPFNKKIEGTEGKKSSGGVTSETLERIKHMVSQRHSHGSEGSMPMTEGVVGGNLYDFGDLSYGHPGAREKLRKPYRQNLPPYGSGGMPPYSGGVMPPYSGGGMPPYSGGGMPPYSGGGMPPYSGGGIPPYGGGMIVPPYGGGVVPPYGGGGTYKPGDTLPDIEYDNQHPLSLYDYEHIWVEMLQEIYKIMKDKYLLEDTHLASKVLDHLFKMLNDIKILSKHTVEYEPSCPKIYHKKGDLCLSVDFLTTFLDFHEARLYCQVVKGGDLVMWRDANEFADIQDFIKDIDASASYSYWVGVYESENSDDWRFIDARAVSMGAPFWGVNEHKKIHHGGGYSGPPHTSGGTPPYESGSGTDVDEGDHLRKTRSLGAKRKQLKGSRRTASKGSKRKTNNRLSLRGAGGEGGSYNKGGSKYTNKDKDHLGENTIFVLEPEYDYEDEDYGILWNDDFHYLHATSNEEAEEMNVIPLCQFVPERDQTNFQYGEMVYEGWNEYNEWAGWGEDDKDVYKKLPPHSHYKPYKPQKGRPQRPPYKPYEGGSYGGGNSYGSNTYGGGSSSGGNPYGSSGGTLPYGGSKGTPYGGSGGTYVNPTPDTYGKSKTE